MENLNLFTGIVQICLWIRYTHEQETGPPLKNAFVQFRAKTPLYDSETKIIATTYTDESGCVSETFEVTSASTSIDIIADTPQGSVYSYGYHGTSTQIVRFAETGVDIDNLPEKYFPRLYSCSTCKNASDAYLCNLGWEYKPCCGYDFDTDQCREVQFNPSFSFGNVCEECKEVDINENQIEEPGFKESNPPIDCSMATHYYPDASMDTPKNERGSLSPLTDHACTYPEYNTTEDGNVYTYGTSCCAYDYATEQCGLWENNSEYKYMNEANGWFLYPCSFGPSKNIGAIAGGVCGALICALAVAYIAYKRRLGSTKTQSRQDEESNRPTETMKDQQTCNFDGNNAANYENVTPVPLPSAPPKEEYDIAIASPVFISNNGGDNRIVYDAQIVADNRP